MALSPVEVVQNSRYWILAFVISAVFLFIIGDGIGLYKTFMMSLPAFAGLFMGTVMLQVFLPVLPGKYFSMKGFFLGLLPAILLAAKPHMFFLEDRYVFIAGYSILILVMTSWTAFKFTGSTTYTSMSGVEIETGKLMPLLRIATYLGFALIFTGMVTASGF